MNKDQDKQRAQDLEKVVQKNQQYLDTVAEDLLQACIGARTAKEIPDSVIENVLKVYSSMRARLSEIEVVRALLLRRHNRSIPENPRRTKMIAELDAHIAELSGRLRKKAPQAAVKKSGRPEPSASKGWLRVDDNSLAFTINARLLDELEYEAPLKPGESPRVVQQSGRGFTLFSLRGPASALDAVAPCLKLRQHDIIERFSATEIRGVLTHLRRISTNDIKQIFERLVTCRFQDVKCILVGLHAPDQLDETFLKYIDRTSEEMRPGDIRTIDIADHG